MLGQHGRRWWVNIKQTFWSRVCQSHIFIFLVWSLCAQNWSKIHHALDNSLCWQYIYRPTWVRWTRHAIWRMSQGWLVFDKHSGRWSHIQAGWVVSRRYRGGGQGWLCGCPVQMECPCFQRRDNGNPLPLGAIQNGQHPAGNSRMSYQIKQGAARAKLEPHASVRETLAWR